MYLSQDVIKKCFFSKRHRAHAVWKNIIYFVTLRDKYTVSWNKKVCKISPKFTIGFFVPTYSVFVAKCSKINNIFRSGEWGTVWKKIIFRNTSRQIYTLRGNKKAYKFPTYCVSVFCSNLECISSYIYRKLPIYIGNLRYS